jgi:hypothetical protein
VGDEMDMVSMNPAVQQSEHNSLAFDAEHAPRFVGTNGFG